MSANKRLFPLMIDLSEKKILIIGDGKVAMRKASKFSEYTEQLEIIKENLSTATDLQLFNLMEGAFLIIPATDDHLFNARVCKLAATQNILVNQIDAVGEVIVPSVISEGDLTIGISTQGSSPALAKFTRKKISRLITPQYAEMARLQSEIRDMIKLQINDQQNRKQILWKILDNTEVWDALDNSFDKALQLASDIIIEQLELK